MGRPDKLRRQCKVCHWSAGTYGDLKYHFKKSHMKAKKYSKLPKSDKQDSNGERDYICPVKDCNFSFNNSSNKQTKQKQLSAHLKNENAHTLKELLDSGA